MTGLLTETLERVCAEATRLIVLFSNPIEVDTWDPVGIREESKDGRLAGAHRTDQYDLLSLLRMWT